MLADQPVQTREARSRPSESAGARNDHDTLRVRLEPSCQFDGFRGVILAYDPGGIFGKRCAGQNVLADRPENQRRSAQYLVTTIQQEFERIRPQGNRDIDVYVGIFGSEMGGEPLLVLRLRKARIVEIFAVDLELRRPLCVQSLVQPAADSDGGRLRAFILVDNQHPVDVLS